MIHAANTQKGILNQHKIYKRNVILEISKYGRQIQLQIIY